MKNTTAFDELSAENQRLRDAIQAQTIELERKNRELEIEAALDRVRAKTMAMHRSDELGATSLLLFDELKALGEISEQISIGIFDEENQLLNLYATVQGEQWKEASKITLDEPHAMQKIYGGWQQHKKSIRIDLSGEELKAYNRFRSQYSNLKYPEERWVIHCAFFSKGVLSFSTTTPHDAQTMPLLERFAQVFDGTYTRFLDLQKAEAQAREAQIEAALERVRARTMAMHNSDELLETGTVLFKELSKLEVKIFNCGYVLMDDKAKMGWNYGVNPGDGTIRPLPTGIPQTGTKVLDAITASWRKQEPSLIIELDPQETIAHQTYVAENMPNFSLTKEQLLALTPERLVIHTFNFKHGFLLLADGAKLTTAQQEMLGRFASVFEMTYTRFLDLQKAEAQAREAQIEAALERVRARSMAMHHTSEIQKVIHTVHEELLHLNISIHGGSFIVINDDIDTELLCWGAGGTANTSELIHVPHFGMPFCTNLINGIKQGEGFFTEEFTQQEKKEYFTELFKHHPWSELDDEQQKETLNSEGGYTRSCCVAKHTSILIVNQSGKTFAEEENDILKRFSKVFEQTYTRFLDLQKAEAQAREAKIEVALERVRARTMAMHKSEELPKAANLLFQQIQALGIRVWSTAFNILSEDKRSVTCNVSSEGQLQPSFILPLTEEKSLREWHDAVISEEPLLVQELGGKDLEQHYEYLFTLSGVKDAAKPLEEVGIALPTYQINHICTFKQGFLLFITYEKVPDAHPVFRRFTSAFQQTYTRFLDLQKAEAQAREAQINLAVERVRARALAMFKSEEILEVVFKLKEEIMCLNIPGVAAATILLRDKNGMYRNWDLTSMEQEGESMHLPLDISFDLEKTHPDFYLRKVWSEGIKYTVVVQDVKSLQITTNWLRDNNKIKEADEADHFIKTTGVQRVFHPTIPLNNGRMCIDLLEAPSNEIESILRKMGSAFDLAYKRFEDLQKAEAQAREAQIEAALERVRAEAMAMHLTEDFGKVARQLLQQVQNLSLKGFTGATIYLIDESEFFNCYDFSSFGNMEDAKNQFLRYDAKKFPLLGRYPLNQWKKGERYFELDFDFEKLQAAAKEFEEINVKVADALKGALTSGHLTHQWDACGRLSNGFIAFDMTNPPNDDVRNITVKMTHAFEQAYIRFLDLQKAEAQSREAQIEAALERIRAQSMMMQHSDELNTTSHVFHEQLLLLGLPSELSYVWLPDEANGTHMFWATWSESHNGTMSPRSKAITYPLDKTEPYTAACFDMWESDEDVFVTRIQPEEVEGFFATWSELVGDAENLQAEQFPDGLYYAEAYMKYGCFGINIRRPLDEAEQELLRRFANEFERTYTRFLDLQKAEEQARKIKLVNQENERLLHSILPQPIAEEIRSGRHNVVKRFEEVSILFADIVGFTALSEKLKPGQVVDILNGLFSKFDDLTDQYGLEKIKTIGDAYMVAAGVPEKRVDHALTIFHFAQDMLRSLEEYNQENNSRMKIRIGISSGPVVAGVIGKKKFAYDLWGDSVNTAARMEAYGREGKIQVSPTSYELLKNDFAFEKISGVNIKGKGVMDVYLWKV